MHGSENGGTDPEEGRISVPGTERGERGTKVFLQTCWVADGKDVGIFSRVLGYIVIFLIFLYKYIHISYS